jgi:hypothetical protein
VIRQKAEGGSSDSSGSEQDTETEMETDDEVSDNKENHDERIAPGSDEWGKEPKRGERSDIARRGIVTGGWTGTGTGADTIVAELALTTGGLVPFMRGAEHFGEASREARSGKDRETSSEASIEASREASREASSGEALSARSRPSELMPAFREKSEMPKTARAAPPSHSSKNMSDLPRRYSVNNSTSSNSIRSRSASSSSSTSSVRVGIRNSFDRVPSSFSPPIESEAPFLHSTTQPRSRESANLSPNHPSSHPLGDPSRPPRPSTRVLQERRQESKQESRPRSREDMSEEDRQGSKQESKKRAPSAARVRRPSSGLSRPSTTAGMPRVRAFNGVSPIDLRGISTGGHTNEDRVWPPQHEEFVTGSKGRQEEFASSEAPRQGLRRPSAGSRAQTSQGQRPARKSPLVGSVPASTTEYARPRSKERLDNMVEILITIPITSSS